MTSPKLSRRQCCYLAAGAGGLIVGVAVVRKVRKAKREGCSPCERRKQWLREHGMWPQEENKQWQE